MLLTEVRGAGSGETKHMPSFIQVTAKVNQIAELLQQVKLDTLINLCRVRIWAFQLQKVPRRSLNCEPTTATNSVHWVASSLMLLPPADLPSPWQYFYQILCAYGSQGPKWHVYIDSDTKKPKLYCLSMRLRLTSLLDPACQTTLGLKHMGGRCPYVDLCPRHFRGA